ncbi:MAG: hypothetical protein ABIO05_05385 [Ferruginibacter sp.]
MKKITTFIVSCSLLLLNACDNDKKKDTNDNSTEATTETMIKETVLSESPAGSGTYNAQGRTYTGIVTTETNEGLRNLYTVTCKGDMIQMIELNFKNEEVARKGGTFKPGSLVPGAGGDNEVGIMFGIGYKSGEASDGTITVTGSGGKNFIELNDVKLTIPDKSITVSGKIPF